ncbi:hypothetical protein DFJ74DRAFT_739174 [Hyaloraphidium curvatum]|nr:hypothetical protein DFJ74DRAFT_739174 [Hyaloraphidium curvatum]
MRLPSLLVLLLAAALVALAARPGAAAPIPTSCTASYYRNCTTGCCFQGASYTQCDSGCCFNGRCSKKRSCFPDPVDTPLGSCNASFDLGQCRTACCVDGRCRSLGRCLGPGRAPKASPSKLRSRQETSCPPDYALLCGECAALAGNPALCGSLDALTAAMRNELADEGDMPQGKTAVLPE